MNSDSIWAEDIPAEILGSICLYLIPPPVSCFYHIKPPCLRDMINTSQVCQRWYDIITSDPMLWNTSIDPHHPCPEWTNLLLHRSGSSPITFLNTTENETPKEMYHEMQYADKLLQYIPLPRGQTLQNNIPRHWPHLLSVCLTHPSLLSENFPGPGMSQLAILHFHSCFVSRPYQITQFGATLKELRITDLRFGPQLSLNSLIGIIKGLPNLRRLYIRDSILGEGTQDNERFKPTVTLNLEDFFLEEDAKVCLRLLQRIDISTTTRALSIDTTIYSNHDNRETILDHLLPLDKLHRRLLGQHLVLSISYDYMVVSGFDENEEPFNPHIPRDTRKKPVLDTQETTNLQYGYLSFAIVDITSHTSSFLPHIQPLLDNIEVIDMWSIFGYMTSHPLDDFYTSIIESASRVRCIIGVNRELWNFMYEEVMKKVGSLEEYDHDTDTDTDINIEDTTTHRSYILANLEVLVLVDDVGGNQERWVMCDDFGDDLIHFCSTLQILGSPICYIKIYSPCTKVTESLTEEMIRLGITLEVEKIEGSVLM